MIGQARTTTDLIADAEWLLESRESMWQVARRLGYTQPESLARRLHRVGEHELAARFERVGVAVA